MATAEVIVRPGTTKATGTREAAGRREARGADGLATGADRESRTYSGEDRYRMIAEAAYFRAEMRGFHPGSELDDWLAAEVEVDELLGEMSPRVSA